MKEPTAYLNALVRMWRDGVIARGQVVHVDIAHDGACAMMTGAGVCDCHPLVTVRREAA